MTTAPSQSPARAPGDLTRSVRPARTEDVPAVAAAVADLLHELGATPPPPAALEAETRAHLADPSLGLVLVAEPQEGGAPIGVLTASWARAIQAAGRLLTIEVLWTRRECRDRGVGAALLDALAAAAAAEGVRRVEVGLPREGFPALRATERFYLANGFERLGPRMRMTVA